MHSKTGVAIALAAIFALLLVMFSLTPHEMENSTTAQKVDETKVLTSNIDPDIFNTLAKTNKPPVQIFSNAPLGSYQPYEDPDMTKYFIERNKEKLSQLKSFLVTRNTVDIYTVKVVRSNGEDYVGTTDCNMEFGFLNDRLILPAILVGTLGKAEAFSVVEECLETISRQVQKVEDIQDKFQRNLTEKFSLSSKP